MKEIIQEVDFIKKEELVVFYARFYKRQITALQSIAIAEKIPVAFVLRGFLDKSIKNHLQKKGEFYCQVCGKLKRNKERHELVVLDAQLFVGDCCYFNEAYKNKARELII